MENRFGVKELLKLDFEVGLGLIALGLWQFSHEVKDRVRREQGNTCAHCGKQVKKLETHHKVPQHICNINGIPERIRDDRSNAIGLCGEDDNDCHEMYDRLAFEEGIVYPNVPLEKALENMRRQARRPVVLVPDGGLVLQVQPVTV